MRKTGIVAALGLATAAVLGPLQAPASAAGQDGVANNNEFLMYYNSIGLGLGSFSDFAAKKPNFNGYTFLSSGAGQGQAVKNNAAAAGNFRTDGTAARVYYNSNYSCAVACDTIPAQYVMNLSPAMKNENASFQFLF